MRNPLLALCALLPLFAFGCGSGSRMDTTAVVPAPTFYVGGTGKALIFTPHLEQGGAQLAPVADRVYRGHPGPVQIWTEVAESTRESFDNMIVVLDSEGNDMVGHTIGKGEWDLPRGKYTITHQIEVPVPGQPGLVAGEITYEYIAE